MPIYTVDVSCRSTAHNYTALFLALREADAVSFLDARWLINVQDDIASLTNALLRHCAPGDGLFVTELAPSTRWTGTGLGEAAKAWIAARSRPSMSGTGAGSPTPTMN